MMLPITSSGESLYLRAVVLTRGGTFNTPPWLTFWHIKALISTETPTEAQLYLTRQDGGKSCQIHTRS